MADPNNISQYKYVNMSNLVLQHDKRFSARRTDEVTGDPESLAGRINIRDMGSRNARDAAPKSVRKPQSSLQGLERGTIREGADILEREQRKRKRGPADVASSSTILSALDAGVEGLKYQPRTPATRQTYDLILTTTANHLGDVPHEVVRSAADAVLEYLKDDSMRDLEKKKEVDDLLGIALDPKSFNNLVNLGKKITDYNQEGNADEADGGGLQDEAELDERQGVAVEFDDNDDEDEDNAYNREVRDDMSDGSEDPEAAPERTVNQANAGEETPFESSEFLSSDKNSSKSQDKTIMVQDIDAYYVQRLLGTIFPDAHTQQSKTQESLSILSGADSTGQDRSVREIENDMMELFDYEHHELVERLILNRDKLVWATRWRRSADDEAERATVERQMTQLGLQDILNQLLGKQSQTRDSAAPSTGKKLRFDNLAELKVPQAAQDADDGPAGSLQPKRLINLDNLVFDQGNHLMTNPNVKLPQGSTKRTYKGYEEIHVPAPKSAKNAQEPNLPTTTLPEWARPGFGSSKHLNRIQTRCYPSAFKDDGNMLVCAPTGSGKTNVAMLAMLREIGKHRNESGEIALDDFKIVYIAPLKALVQEQVGNFGKRLQPYGITVSELTGDRQLTKQQIAETQVIVTTPEKWDVITRKATDTSYTNLVKLIVIDEIHLLHDDRGPVLESIVSRTIRRTEQTGDAVRILGLSATLPNYRDVASFLRVELNTGLFHFDASFRPCPLRQEFIGITEKKAIKQLKTMNDVCYNKVLEQVGTNKQQMLIFVHSRKETAKTARYIRDRAIELATINQIFRSDAASKEVLEEESAGVTNEDLKNLMPYGFGIHHAGMSRADRSSVEDLFADGMLQVLVCTATLAWGVNLPAHTVIIKGTQIYSPEKGSWVELSPQDVLQMLGRAGRPQYDTFGEGIIITTQGEMQYYLSLMNQQLPIESQLISKLADSLNAEIVLGNIRSMQEGVDWLGYTYLFVRMLRSPGLYSVGAEYEDDGALVQKRVDLIHSAATVLERSALVKYDKKTGKLQATELGRIASHYYITHSSMLTYNQHLQPSISTIELFRIFALSDEFKYIPVRQDEKLELAKLLGRVPIPVKEGLEEGAAKINVLLQAFISRLKLDGLALMADLVYVTQSAGRILRAIFEICLKKGWSLVARSALDLCKMAEKRMWPTMSPLRQFPKCPPEVITKAEKIDVPWSAYFGLDPARMGELLGLPKHGRNACQLVESFPRQDVQVQVQPVTRSLLFFEVVVTPDFVWDDAVHGLAESFWILVEDCDGEQILYHDSFILRKDYAISDAKEHVIEFTVSVADPMPPNYFISLVSDRWLRAETRIAVSFEKLILPAKFPPHTPLLDLQPVPVTALKRKELEVLYPNFTDFNRIQSQVFNTLFQSSDSAFIGAATGSGKTVCAELALLRLWSSGTGAKAVYIAPFQESVNNRLVDWQQRLGGLFGGRKISKLVGETAADLKILDQSHLVLSTPTQWDVLSRQWQRRKNVQAVRLLVADDLHMIGGQGGFIYEMVVSRMQYIKVQTKNDLRIVGLSVPVSNARDIGEWFEATKSTIFNFSPQVRPVPLELHIQSFSIPHFPSMMLAMAKPTYAAIVQMSADKPALIFVSNRKQSRATALDLLTSCLASDDQDRFLHTTVEEMMPLVERVNENALANSLTHGIGYYHEALSPNDKRIVAHLYRLGAVQVLIASREVCWELDVSAHLVVIMGTQFFEGKEHRYIDYPMSEVLQMFGKANNAGDTASAKGLLLLPAVKREYYKKLLHEALPIESQLHVNLHDAFVSEISSKVITSTQDAVDWSTYTFFYRRLLANPSFYGLTDTSHEGLSAHLSELIESSLKDLSEAKIIDLDEEDDSIQPLNAAMISAYYNISFITMQTFLLSLNAKTKLKGILEIVTSATELETIQIRRHEERLLRRLYDRVPVKMAQPNYESPHFKAFVLLQAHFSRLQLPVDLAKDQEIILTKILGLLSGCVDVLSSEGHLNAMNAMEISQMAVQAMWDRDSTLKQIPHFGSEAIQASGAKDIFEFMELMDPSENADYDKVVARLGLSNAQLAEAAAFTNNKYPNVEMEFEVEDRESIATGQPAHLQVRLSRDVDEDESVDTSVHAPFYPLSKMENWWLVVGDEHSKALLAIKRVSFDRKLDVRLEYIPQRVGEQELTLYLMCDSYVGVDQDPRFTIIAAEGMDEEEEESS